MGKQRRKFETGFKQQILEEVESGLLSVSAASRKYLGQRDLTDGDDKQNKAHLRPLPRFESSFLGSGNYPDNKCY